MNDTLRTAKQNAASTHLCDLLEAHFREAEDSADEDGRFSIGFRVTFDRSFNPTNLKSPAASPRPSRTKWSRPAKIRSSRRCFDSLARE